MTTELDEFLGVVGTDVPIFRYCEECEGLRITDPETYDKPKFECDPGYCPYWVASCLCDNEAVLYSQERIDKCTFPDCECGNGKEQTGQS